MKRMICLVGVLILVTGAVMASNMGFKFVPNIPLANPNTYAISLPLNNNYTTADSVFDDIAASGGGCANVSLVRRRTSVGTVDDWTGTSGLNFPVVIGEAYTFQTTTGSPVVNWTPAHY